MTTVRYGFTPGPWYVCDNGHVREYASDVVIAEPTDGLHADPDVQIFGPDTIEANARAISLVPELVAALEPLARLADIVDAHMKDEDGLWAGGSARGSATLTVGHARTARTLLAALEKEK